MKLRTEAPVNGGRNYNGPKVNDLASLSKIWLFAGRSEYPKLRDSQELRDNARVQIISRKGQWVGHDFSRAAKGANRRGFSP